MIRVLGLLLSLPASIAGLFVADTALSLSLVEMVAAITLIIGFAVVATGWTIRRDP